MSETDPPVNAKKVTFTAVNAKVTFTPHLFGQAPIIPEVSAVPGDFVCDCGCMEIEREPAGDLTFYRDPAEGLFMTAGVAKGFAVFSQDGEVQQVLDGSLLSEGDGKFYWQPNEGES